jgi:hypothetical protein
VIESSQAYERVKERDRLAALGEMSAGLAHEIRNPLGAIKGAAQLLVGPDRKPLPLGAESAEFIDIILEEVDRLNNVVSRFLDYARADRGEGGRPQPIDLNHVVKKVVALLASAPEAKGIDVRVRYDEQLPKVVADPEALVQVFLNLGLNAVQAMPDGGTPRDPHHPPPALAARLRPVRRGPPARHRPRHRRRQAAQAVHPVLHDQGARHRPRPRDRPAHRQPVRRHHRGALDAGRRLDVLGVPAGRAGHAAVQATTTGQIDQPAPAAPPRARRHRRDPGPRRHLERLAAVGRAASVLPCRGHDRARARPGRRRRTQPAARADRDPEARRPRRGPRQRRRRGGGGARRRRRGDHRSADAPARRHGGAAHRDEDPPARADRHDDRARLGRARGRGDQGRRLRLHREAVRAGPDPRHHRQGRAPGRGQPRRAPGRPVPAQRRRARAVRADRRLGRDALGVRRDRAGRRRRRRPCSSPARAAPARSWSPRRCTRARRRRRPVHQDQLRRDPQDADGVGAVRLREGRVHRRHQRPSPVGSSWPTAARCSSTRSARSRSRCRSSSCARSRRASSSASAA